MRAPRGSDSAPDLPDRNHLIDTSQKDNQTLIKVNEKQCELLLVATYSTAIDCKAIFRLNLFSCAHEGARRNSRALRPSNMAPEMHLAIHRTRLKRHFAITRMALVNKHLVRESNVSAPLHK